MIHKIPVKRLVHQDILDLNNQIDAYYNVQMEFLQIVLESFVFVHAHQIIMRIVQQINVS